MRNQVLAAFRIALAAAAAGMALLNAWPSQAQDQSSAPLAFEVASVKPAPPPQGGRILFGPPRGGPGTSDPGRITWSNASLTDLLMTAYDVRSYQISGPAWLNTERYDIAAKVPAGATAEQVRLMWQNLLAERFGMVLHHETKNAQIEQLVVAKGGPKLKESAAKVDAPGPPVIRSPRQLPPDASAPDPPDLKNGNLSDPGLVALVQIGPNGPTARVLAKAQPISKLAEMLANQLHQPVLDKTGLAGTYDFTLEFTPDMNGLPLPPMPRPGPESGAPPGESTAAPGTDLNEALQQQLGLKLVRSKGKLDILVIDKAEKVPTAD